MSEYSRRILLGGVVAAIVGISVVVGIVYLPLANSTTSQGVTTSTICAQGNTTASCSISTSNTSIETTNSTLGLKLSLSLQGSTLYDVGQSVSINITEYNIFGRYNNVSDSDKWEALTMQIMPCESVLSPANRSH